MVVVCQQPNYFPWLGYLELAARADIFVVLDSVQWIRQGRQHRARILPYQSGRSDFQWLTLPVLGHGHRTRPMRDLALDPADNWSKRHWATVAGIYGRRPFFKSQLEPLVRPWFEQAPRFKTMYEAALSSVELCFSALDLSPTLMLSSELPEQGVKTERLISICKSLEADTYYSALGSTKYVDVAAFRASGIRLQWQHWKHPNYDQGTERFKSHLSFLDVLANASLDDIKAWMVAPEWGQFGESGMPKL